MIVRLLVVLLMFAASAFAGDGGRGNLLLIGGGDKPEPVMKKFVELAGGTDAPIVVVPTASEEPDTKDYYEKLFGALGCTNVVVLPIRTKEDALKADVVAAARRARGIFFGGGDQSRITRALLGTPVLEAFRDAYARGAVIGGTSAGTACQSDLMITGEGDFTVIGSGAVEIAEGLGFLPDWVIVDQHFIARQRQNRLITVILERPDKLGVGVDEATAIWVKPDNTLEVLGERSVMIFDAGAAVVDREPGKGGRDLFGVRDLKVHVLLPGDQFDLSRCDDATRRRLVDRPK